MVRKVETFPAVTMAAASLDPAPCVTPATPLLETVVVSCLAAADEGLMGCRCYF